MKVKIISVLLIVLCTFSLPTSAQYRNFNIKEPNTSVELVQIDCREYSTLVHLRYKNNNAAWIGANEKFHIIDLDTGKKYKIINAFNIPISNGEKVHMFSSADEVFHFTLEFEKLPESTSRIDILEGVENGFDYHGIELSKEAEPANFIDIHDFISESPLKEFGYYYQEGNVVHYYNHKGLSVIVKLFYSTDYGKYYQAHLLVQNLTGRDVLLNPDEITSQMLIKKKIKDGKVLSYNEYMKKVSRSQMWSSIGVALGESFGSMNAGYSSSTTNTNAQVYSNSFGFASGYVNSSYGSAYGSAYGASSSSTSISGSSTTTSYDGMNAYLAQQNARSNVANYENQQQQIKQSLSDGYLKINTIPNQTEYVGYINISHKKAQQFSLNIPINGSIYQFLWNFE